MKRAGIAVREGFFSQFSTMISQRCPEFQKQWGPSGANRGRSRADPRRILALSCLSALHNIETTLRSVVPPAAELHTYTWCTTSAQNLLPLALSLPLSWLLLLPVAPFLLAPIFPSSFDTRASLHSAPLSAFFFSYHYFCFRQKKKGPVVDE